ncbi:TetR/AcrR family transcriptional regulator [Yinghuangia seranimata]|uniref:TetR/AcrR family transcriptional regulator n=1 Tax=Yinghuangia seranimata TaxID=408067 RepID=UPI00248A9E1D|nr:TetR/AcrR family transcriptional regulator [Yinghuangia seranimata]MDI2129405.1 helix-turn-helix domain-containing protein [Yinghuangia seranimata]
MAATTRRSSGSADRAQAPDLRAQQKQYTRRRLIAAACDVFEAKGYEAATVDDIVAEAGAARATFYLHFTGKADIVAELADRIWADTGANFAAFGELPDWSHATIRGWLDKYVNGASENRQALRIFAEQLPHTLREQHQEHVKDFVAAVMRPPERWAHFSKPEARRRAYLLVTQLETFMPSWMAGRWAREGPAFLHTVATVWRNTLEADRL